MSDETNGFKFQASFKTPAGTLVNVRANDNVEFEEGLNVARNLADTIITVEGKYVGGRTATQPTPQPSAPALGPAAAHVAAIFPAAAGPSVAGEVEKVLESSQAEGFTSKAGKAMTRYSAFFKDGTKAKTITDKIGRSLPSLHGQRVFVQLTQDQYGYELKGIRAA